MTINQAAKYCRLPVRTLRYYEAIGLVSADRQANGYRDYSPAQLHQLRFVQRARSLGFSLDECRALLALYADQARASAEVKQLALGKIAAIEQKIAELHSLKTSLSQLVSACHGDQRPDCPILDDIAASPL